MRTKGFSLIEILVVIGIIAVLSAIAAPCYGDYIVKAKVTELLSVADSYKIKLVDDYFSSSQNTQNIYNINSDLVDYVAVARLDGIPAKHVIQVVAKMKGPEGAGIGIKQPSDVEQLSIQLQGLDTGHVISWSCHVASEYNRYVPKTCQNNNIEQINVG